MFEVQGKTFLVTVEGLEKVTVVLTEEMRSDLPPDITAVLVILDLDDFGPQIGQVGCAEGTSAVLFNCEHTQAGQGQL